MTRHDTALPTAALNVGPAIPSSAGRWIERSPGTFARVTVAVPVIVGPTLTIR